MYIMYIICILPYKNLKFYINYFIFVLNIILELKNLYITIYIYYIFNIVLLDLKVQHT